MWVHDDPGWAGLPEAGDPALAEWLEGASCGPHVKALAVRAADTAAKAPEGQARGRAAIAARTLRTDRWWAYPLTTFTVLLAFVGYATYAAVADRDYYAAP
jgi:hypothetical protein